jgi:hypothetical protein
VGLLVSTPLTLCLVVAGRHVRALEPLTILLGEATNLSAAQHVYQRLLSGETNAIIQDARSCLRRSSFAVGAHLRQRREARLGRWQGPLDVPTHSVVVCIGLGSERDDVLNELLVLALHEAEIDARSVSAATPEERPAHDTAELVFAVFVTYPPAASLDAWLEAVGELRVGLPNALLMTIGMSFGEPLADQSIVEKHVDMVLRSHEEGVAFIEPHRAAQSMRGRGQQQAPLAA